MSNSLPQATYRKKAGKISGPAEPVTEDAIQSVTPNIQEPTETKEDEPAAAVTPPKAAVHAPVRSAVAPSNPITAQIVSCLDVYKNLLSEKRITANQAAQAMAHFKKIVDLTVQNPTVENLATVWSFFKTNKDGICNEKVALTGINTLDAKSKATVTVFYNAFRTRSMGYPNQMRDNEILTVIPSQRLVAFLKTAQ